MTNDDRMQPENSGRAWEHYEALRRELCEIGLEMLSQSRPGWASAVHRANKAIDRLSYALDAMNRVKPKDDASAKAGE